VLNADYLAVMGQLQPGWSGTCQLPLGDTAGNAVATINMRAEAGRLRLSWRSYISTNTSDRAGANTGVFDNAGETEIVIPVIRVFSRFNSRAYFVCPGSGARAADAGSTDTEKAHRSC
jgi:hypothetical protein